ncbi:MAG: hypothetical protein Q8L04_16205 [Ignavibacteria bacterium]|nr:hypothetical protein [Ignavibacteria bacterium]
MIKLKHCKEKSGLRADVENSCAGNFAVSFAVYFMLCFFTDKLKWNKIFTVFVTLFVVELFEITNGFSIIINTFDTYDIIVNILGVSEALGLDLLTKK